LEEEEKRNPGRANHGIYVQSDDGNASAVMNVESDKNKQRGEESQSASEAVSLW
jgi:hypothetical protein